MRHKNLNVENDVGVVGAYPGGKDYGMNYGKLGKRPQTEQHITSIPIPQEDPLDFMSGLLKHWIR